MSTFLDDEVNEPLTPQGQKILKHWLEHRPRMCAELRKQGKLEETVAAADRMTAEALSDLLSKGVPYHEAWEMIREEWAFLPEETG
ncbi:MAG: hypothetical protein JO069_07875 [Verrucomicrobia bacterium]|nr:hypothetical protein [Verrucomicrobiota bacterium]